MSSFLKYEPEKFNSIEYRRSRIAYIGQCTFEYLITLLITDAFLAKLLTSIGISDSLIGIISSFVHFSFLFQLMSLWLINVIKSVKKTVMIFDTLSQVLYISMYCIPFLNIDISIKIFLIIAAILLAYISKYLVSSILFKWANSYVEPHKRGGFSAVKEMISLFCGMVFSLAVGFVIDEYELAGNLQGGFIFIIIILSVLNIFNFISLIMIKDGEVSDKSSELNFKELLANTIGNKNFRSVIVLLSMWTIATSITTGFMGTFKTNDLLLSVGIIQVINVVANGFRILFSIPLGKFSDKRSYAKGIELAMVIAAVGFAINMFTSNKTWWFVAVYTVLYNISVAGTNANKFNITYSYVKNDYIAQAMAIQNCISGVLGFLAALVGSRILDFVQANDNMLFGIHIYGQQLLSGISLVIVIIAIVYDRLVVEKQKVKVQ